MTPASNKIMLITYSDSIGKNIADLRITHPACDGELSVEDDVPLHLTLTQKPAMMLCVLTMILRPKSYHYRCS